MDQLTVGQFKANFSTLLTKVLQGKSINITYGKNKKKVATLVPYKKYFKQHRLKLGLLEGTASFKIHKDFKLTDNQLLRQ